MTYTFLLIAFGLAVADWIAVEKDARRVRYLTKPGVMVAGLLFLLQNGAVHGALLWFFVGAAFSLAGDVLLLLPSRWFVAGLLAFLLGHLCYIVGFNLPAPSPSWITLVAAILMSVIVAWMFRRLSAGMAAKGESRMKVAVLVYEIVLSLMLLSALTTLGRWELLPGLLVSVGALLFVCSDSMLAWGRFVASFRHGHLLVMVTYHLGQFGILLGAFWQWVFLSN